MKRLREIGISPAGGRFAVALAVAQAHVPFADEAGAVARITQYAGHSRPVRLNQGIALRTEEHPPFHSAAPRVTPSKQPVPRGRAAAGRRVRVGEAHAHPSQPLHLRRVQLHGSRIAGEILIRTRVPHTHVIGHEENDVGLGKIIGRMQ